jgi:hypothetical protein
VDEEEKEKPSTSSPASSKNSNGSQENSNSNNNDIKFNYKKYSFNFLYRLCYDYHACRAEFGRCGGLIKFINVIEKEMMPLSPLTSSPTHYCEEDYERIIEVICLCCKESINRLRLREQGYLVYLVKLQQILKKKFDQNDKTSESSTINNNNSCKNKMTFVNSTDFHIHNKLLVALCCFSHDQDSMNILLNNNLVDSLIEYLNELISFNNSTKIEKLKPKEEKEEEEEGEEVKPQEEKLLCLKTLLELNKKTGN